MHVFVFHRYKQNHARKWQPPAAGEPYRTKQFEVCVIGGAQSKGGNKLARTVASMAAIALQPVLAGESWGTGSDQSAASASLSFAVPVKPVTISGTLSVHPQSQLTGSLGLDRDTSVEMQGLADNTVNAAWEGPDTFKWQGSTHFQGNVGHGLWEVPQSARNLEFRYIGQAETFCGRLLVGCD